VVLARSYAESLTPRTTVKSSFFAGAETMTFCAPASMCARGLGGVGEEAGRLDDDVAPSSFHGSDPGIALLEGADLATADDDVLVVERDVLLQAAEDAVVLQQVGQRLVVGEVVAPTTSMSAPWARAARKKLRPIRRSR
jgi:hypothetical protein